MQWTADKLNPDQWVNVYYLKLLTRLILIVLGEVKELNLDNPEDL